MYDNNYKEMGMTPADEMLLQQKQQMQTIPTDNPFEDPRYRQISTPDTPLQYGGGMAEMLLSDADVPEPLRKKYWWVFNRDNVLTFLDEKRKRFKMMAFDVTLIDNMNAMQSFDDYNFDVELQFNIIRNALDVKLDRAVGFKGTGTKNERIILQSQFSEARNINEQDQGPIREGFFKRLLGRRG
jgi:hypothetical protein